MLRHHFSRRLKFSLKVRFNCTARLKLTPICNVFEPLFIAHILRTTILTSCALPPVCSVALAISMFLDTEGCFRMKEATRRVRLYTWKANAVTRSLNWPTVASGGIIAVVEVYIQAHYNRDIRIYSAKWTIWCFVPWRSPARPDRQVSRSALHWKRMSIPRNLRERFYRQMLEDFYHQLPLESAFS